MATLDTSLLISFPTAGTIPLGQVLVQMAHSILSS